MDMKFNPHFQCDAVQYRFHETTKMFSVARLHYILATVPNLCIAFLKIFYTYKYLKKNQMLNDLRPDHAEHINYVSGGKSNIFEYLIYRPKSFPDL